MGAINAASSSSLSRFSLIRQEARQLALDVKQADLKQLKQVEQILGDITGSNTHELPTHLNRLFENIEAQDPALLEKLVSEFGDPRRHKPDNVSRLTSSLNDAYSNYATGAKSKPAPFRVAAMTDIKASGELLSKKDIKEMIEGLLKNGIEDPDELHSVLVLAGMLGGSISFSMLSEIDEAVRDFITGMANQIQDPEELLDFLDLVSDIADQASNDSSVGETLSPEPADTGSVANSIGKLAVEKLAFGKGGATDILDLGPDDDEVEAEGAGIADLTSRLQFQPGAALKKKLDSIENESTPLEKKAASSKLATPSSNNDSGSQDSQESPEAKWKKIGALMADVEQSAQMNLSSVVLDIIRTVMQEELSQSLDQMDQLLGR